MHINYKKAFTLVELIVVITILAILGTITFISLQGYSKSSRDSVRISDISNIKTALELFHLNSGKYPLPDDLNEVTFSGNLLWSQGEFGSTVVSQLSRNINEIPTDPLSDKKYIYSVANNKNEFEILALLESDLVLNSVNEVNAANIVVTPRVDGTYNGVFIKTPDHIVPVPSILNSEVGEVELILNENNIKSQVVSNGGNIPNHGNINYSTGELNIILSVYTGSLDKNSDDSDKEEAMIAIQEAYTGSELAGDIKYANILSKTDTENIIMLFNTIVLGNNTINIQEIVQILTYQEQGLCNEPDIHIPTLCTEGDAGCFVIASCNVGSTTASTAYNNNYGELFQWGNNGEIRNTLTTSSDQITVTLTGSTFNSNVFIYNNSDWNLIQNDDLWGNSPGTDLDRKGPCADNYHIPSNQEWIDLHTIGGWSNNGQNMSDDLKLPMAGWRKHDDATMTEVGTKGKYWSSSPAGVNVLYMDLNYSTYIDNSNLAYRSRGYAIRCFKN